jgi:thioredoxin reductase
MNKIVAVVGGGPSGMSCALWLKHLGFVPILIEKNEKLGGLQTLSHFQNVWYLGIPGKTGYELADQFHRHVEAEMLSTVLDSSIKEITKVGDDFRIVTDKTEITARYMVIATGQRVTGFEAIESVPGSKYLLSSQRVCFNPGATPLLGSKVSGGVVAVVGGGDNGLVTARILGNTSQHIHLFIRSEIRAFEVNKRAMFEQIAAGRVSVHQPAKIQRFEMREEKIYMLFQDENNQEKALLFDYLCFRLGFTPNVEELVRLFEQGGVGSVKLTEKGYIATDRFLRTSIPNIYAAGDVTNPRDPCVATAVAHGAIAAHSIEEDLGLSCYEKSL